MADAALHFRIQKFAQTLTDDTFRQKILAAKQAQLEEVRQDRRRKMTKALGVVLRTLEMNLPETVLEVSPWRLHIPLTLTELSSSWYEEFCEFLVEHFQSHFKHVEFVWTANGTIPDAWLILTQ